LEDLAELAAQGYAGAPIRDQAGRVIGVVWVISRKPLKPPAQWKAVLSIIAAKTSAEIERKRAEAALSRRLETEKLVTSISARFINVRPDELGDEISTSLRRIGEFSGIDRCYLFQFSADGATMDNTHEWCAPGIEPHIDELQGQSVDHFGFSMAKMRAGEIFHVPSVADLPPEAGPEVQEFEREGILSLINVPVQIGGVTAGFLGFDMVRKAKAWPEQDLRMIRLVGETFAMALERKRFEEDTQRSLREKEVLLREIHHRVKNNMQIVSSLLVLQSSRTRNREAVGILEDGRQRVQAMALAHEKLYRTVDLAHIDLQEYLTSLLSSIRSTYLAATPGISVQAHIENVTSNMDQAIPIGLLVNELASNALKHAFPEGGSGTVSVGLALEAEDMIELTVADDGVGLPRDLEWRNVPTLGLTLVGELSAQLGGDIELLERTHGTAFRIRFKQATV
jgi:two-component sensor histidine kinase